MHVIREKKCFITKKKTKFIKIKDFWEYWKILIRNRENALELKEESNTEKLFLLKITEFNEYKVWLKERV